MTPVETLRSAMGSERDVTVVVGEHSYRCCGGGWHTRGPEFAFPLGYVGRVLSMDSESFLLWVTNDTGGKRADVICSFDNLQSVSFNVD